MNILITGASGYMGSILLDQLSDVDQVKTGEWKIIATDVRESSTANKSVKFVKLDVRSAEVNKVIQQYNIHTVVHLASIVTPGKKSNRDFEYSVDVLGTENILKACVENSVKRIVLTSSGAAYGYHPDNSNWLKEDDPIRGNKEFAYAYHKRLIEEILAKYRINHPQLEQVVFRIGTILGDSTNNQITALFEKKVLLGISGSKSPFVFIWDYDVAECLLRAINGSNTGVYNLAGDGALTIEELAKILNKPVLKIPAWLMSTLLFILKRLSLSQYGEEQVNFLRYRPVLDNHKLKTSFGYSPKLTSREVFHYFLQSKQAKKEQSTKLKHRKY